MKKLRVDLSDLSLAFEDASEEMSYFLDLETGQVVWLTQETRELLERVYEEEYDPGSDEPLDFTQVLEGYGLPEWQKELLLEADQVDRQYGSRYIEVPKADSHEDYRVMEDFVLTVQDERLQDHLWRAIEGRGAFRRFRDVLADHYHEEKRWYAFRDERVTERVLEWLESQGIQAIIPEPAPEQEPGLPEPTPRELLLAEALAFVQAASQLRGVTRMALIGSLATDEPDPKDVDLLLTVTDDMDLALLAELSRKLQGHAQSFARGGEVFLADPRGHYLGRTCPWKRCGPGIRASCDALHCGRRRYLHDDLKTVRLAESLIAAPPIELWPEVVTRMPVPEDVAQKLLSPLREGQSE